MYNRINRKVIRRGTAAFLTVMLALTAYLPYAPTVSAAEPADGKATEFTVLSNVADPSEYDGADPGLWITEIYHNDVNRSAVYTTTSDVMEFVEIVNTSNSAIVFNDTYTLWYEYLSGGNMVTQTNPLTITSNEPGNPAIGPGETVVIRVARPDIVAANPDQYPSDDAFRKTMDVPQGVKIWSATGQNGWAESARGCSIRLKSDKNTILSRYIYNFSVESDGTIVAKDNDVTSDGLSVQLQIPDYGYEMLPWEINSMPDPGYVYNGQYNGQKVIIPEVEAPEGLFITEILPQDSSSATSARFGSGSNQILEFVELTNTTNRDIDLNEEYQLTYSSKANNGVRNYAGGNERVVIITQPDDPYNDECIIPAGKSAVIWIHREASNTTFLQEKYGINMGMLSVRGTVDPSVTTVYDTWPTEADFREIRGIAADVPVFTCRNINGLGNAANGFALRKTINPNTDQPELVTKFITKLASTYAYDTANKGDTSGGRSVSLKVSPEGPKMTLYEAKAVPSPGVVEPEQMTYLVDDGKTPVIREWDTAPVPASIDQGDIFRTPYYYEDAKSIELFYKTSNSNSFSKDVITSFSIYNKWYTFIPSDVLLHADYFDYYIKAKGVYRSVQTDMKRVVINKINDETGLRASLNGTTATNNEAVSGTLNVTAKNFADTSAPVTMTLDGENLPVSASLEKGAFFTFTHNGGNGLDAYFKNALVVKDHEDDDHGEIIKLFPKYSEVPGLSSMAVRVDSKYFTYNPDGSANVDLYIYAGTNGSTFESFTSENNDDFTVQWIRLSLPDGTTFRPTEYKGYRVGTGADGAGTAKLGWFNLDPDAQIAVGDSNNLHVYVKASFTIPAASAALDAYATEINTTQLSDGAHSLVVTSGASSKTITLNVDNSLPVPEEPEQLPATDLSLTVDVAQSPVKATITARDGDQDITVYQAEKADIKVYEGTGDSTAAAAEKTDSDATVSTNGEFPYQIYELTAEAAQETDSLRFDITAASDYGREVQLYALNVENSAWELLRTTKSGDNITAIFPLADRLEDGKVKVLVQARGIEFAPYTQEHTARTENNNYAQEWTGEGEHAVPKQYDFSLAWFTDTQYYSEQYHNHFKNIVDWIIEKKDELKIKYAPHTGDIVDEWDEEDQFLLASDYLKKFEDAGMPYGVLAGNHDVAHGAEKYGLYWKYFGEDRYQANSYYGGSYKDNLGHYDLVTVDGVEMIFVYMSWDIYYPETDWINSVLEEYSDRKAIIAVHCGINASAAQSYQSKLLLNEVCSKNKNVFAIINGHYHGSALNFEGFDDDGDGTSDRVVYQICTDYQSGPEGGSGYIKMLYFDLANDKIYINSYSPSLDDYNYYDTPKLEDYPIGLNIYDIDITELDVEFDRESAKALNATGAKAAVLTGTRLGSAPANGVTEIELASATGVEEFAYAVATDENGEITAYSRAVALVAATISDVVVTPEAVTVLNGMTQTFSATVNGTGEYDNTVTWSVSGNNSSGTAINSFGVLTVATDETADTLTVTAVSNGDSTKSGTATVTVTDEPAVITSVTVSPANPSVQKGTAQIFSAAVNGIGEYDNTVTWSVSGNGSSGTAIGLSSGLLTVAADETADTLTVTATSRSDETKSGRTTVRVTDTPPASIYSIALDTMNYTFPVRTEGYAPLAAKNITVTNTGNQDTGSLYIVRSDTDTHSFTLSATSLRDLAVNEKDTFTIAPKDGLTAGTYTEKVTVRGENGLSASLDVSFTVNIAKKNVTSINIAGGSSITTKDGTLQLTVDVQPSDATNNAVTWSIVSGNAASIDSSTGLLTAAANGTVTVRATAQDGSGIFGEKTITISGQDSGGSGPGGGGGGRDSSGATTGNEQAVSTNNNSVSANITGTTDGSGKLTASVGSDTAQALIDSAKKVESSGGKAAVIIHVSGTSTSGSAEIGIGGDDFRNIAAQTNAEVSIVTSVVTVTFDSKAVDTIADSAAGDLKINITKVDTDTLGDTVKAEVGNRPVYDFSITSGNSEITDFGGGSAHISIPYTPGAGEDPNAIVVYYIDASGNLNTVRGAYDPATRMVIFVTTHFSSYVIGYNKVSFTDVGGAAWYVRPVTFIAARGITTGTTATEYSPDGKLTRGQFIVMLMRAYDIAPDNTPSGNFADAGNDYYTNYLSAAKRLGISNGIGNNRFAPKETITRQDMFTLLYNVLKVIGEAPGAHSGSPLSKYTDAGEVSPWAEEALETLVGAGLISGTGGRLNPSAEASRAEMAQVLYNMLSI
ncbi:MAG TPA: S-layer homology domain-containing protein [Anaerovoracaceae bacterium]|nr:S-layer homology domain-containing protein [Anaerovoracaceae bacterium]